LKRGLDGKKGKDSFSRLVTGRYVTVIGLPQPYKRWQDGCGISQGGSIP
jgi:hypothetical protein